MAAEAKSIKPGMRLRIVNDSGRVMSTQFFNAETGEEFMPSGVVLPINITMGSKFHDVEVHLTMRRVPLDLVGTVVGMKMSEDRYCIEVPDTHDAILVPNSNGSHSVVIDRKT